MNTALAPFLNESFSLRDRTVVFVANDGLYDASLPESLIAAGATVVLAGRDLKELEREARGLSPKQSGAIFLDSTRRQSCREALATVIRRHGRVDVLVNTLNAPGPQALAREPMSRANEPGLDAWQLGLSLGLAQAFFPSEVFGTQMSRTGGGAIVNVATDAVASTRAELVDLALTTRYLAEYFADASVRVNALLRGSVGAGERFPAFVSRYSELFPLLRMARTEEAITALLYLAAEASEHVTGRTLMLDASSEPLALGQLFASNDRQRS